MARIRSVKPEFWKSDQIVELSRDARLFFIGLWNFCDDQGVCKNSPRTLRMEIFGGDDDITSDTIRRLLAELINMSLVGVYAVDGVEYIHVFTFKTHQKPERPSYKHPKPPTKPTGYISRATGPRRMISDLFGEPSATEQEKEKEREKESRLAGLGDLSANGQGEQSPSEPASPPASAAGSQSVALGHEVLRILGRDPAQTLQFGQVLAWLNTGYTPEEIKTVAALVGDRMKPEVRDPLRYLGKAMPDEIAKLRAAAKPQQPAGDGPSDTAVRERWRARYRGHKANGTWLDSWGPKPGEPGCECPPDLIVHEDLEVPPNLRRTG